MDTKRFARRAALRATFAAALAAAVPASRRAGALTAATTGAALELPVAGVLVGIAALLADRKRPTPTTTAIATGVLAAIATTRVWPVAPRTSAEIRPALTPIDVEPTEDGDGLTMVVNQDAGSAFSTNPAEALKEQLPAATVIETDAAGMADALSRAADACRALGVAGGDGTISAAAAVAHSLDRPLLIVPAGTLNHLARDLGLTSLDDAVVALRQGDTVAVDVAAIDGKTFLNTASFGAYGELVDAREQLEDRIGKWPALLVALVRVLRHAKPVEVELDGKHRRLWMIFIGNCRYHPAGFAPTWRERMDDGRLDVRLVDAVAPYARTRLLLAIVTGRLGRSRVYEAFTTTQLRVRNVDPANPLRLARDGETFDGSDEFVVNKADRPLAVYVPSSRRSHRPTKNSSVNSATTPAPVSHGPAVL